MISSAGQVRKHSVRKIPHKQWYTRDELIAIAEDVAVKYGLHPAALKAQVSAESGWNPTAVSYRNGKPIAYGISQFTPGTGRSWGLKTKADLFNPRKSLDAMGRLMSSYVKTYKAQGHEESTAYKKAHIAYNCGPACKYPNNTETKSYIARINRLKKQFEPKPKPKTQLATAPVP